MTKLSDVQLVLLASAAQRADGSLLPPPDSLGDQGLRIARTIRALLKHALVAEAATADCNRAWRQDGERPIGVFITDAGRAAIGAEPAARAAPERSASPVDVAKPKPPSKAAQVIALLRREQGATLDELVAATGWLPHTTRAGLTGLRKKGHVLDKSKRADATCYTIRVAA